MQNIILEFNRKVPVLHGENPMVREGSHLLGFVLLMQINYFEDGGDSNQLHIHRLKNFEISATSIGHAD